MNKIKTIAAFSRTTLPDYAVRKIKMFPVHGNEGYLAKVVRQAYESERRTPPEDPMSELELYRLPDGTVWADIDSAYAAPARVCRRVSYRLENCRWQKYITVKVWEWDFQHPHRTWGGYYKGYALVEGGEK